MRTSHPAVAIPLTIICTIAAAVGGGMSAIRLLDPEHPLAPPLAGLAVTVTAMALVYLWRHFLLRRPWSGVGLPWKRSAIVAVLLGVVVGAVAMVAANAATVLFGAATWISPQPDFRDQPGTFLVIALSLSILLQGFPEELLWRGHLYDLLSDTLGPLTVLLLTSVVFGLLHIVSQSGAENIGERLLYVVMAVALGFACGATRARTGAAWMAVGVHSGFHIGLYSFPIESSNYAVNLLLETVMLLLAGLLILGRSGVNARRPAPEDHESRFGLQQGRSG